MIRHFRMETPLEVSAAEAFAWHARPGAFERLAPPWEDLEVLHKSGGIEDGARLTFRVRMGPIWQRWEAEHFGFVAGKQFCDRQLSGPFASWEHTHEFRDRDGGGSVIVDEVRYRLPMAPLSNLTPSFLVEDKISAMFQYRRAVVQNDLRRHHEAGTGSLRVAISGSGGLVGKSLGALLGGGGHEVVPIVRKARAAAIEWDPARGLTDPAQAEGIDAVVHLAGESVVGLWSDSKKRRIRDSRVIGTRTLCESLASLERKPKVLVCASAIGYYGDRGTEAVDENAEGGTGFLADVAREWEAATEPARAAGIRVVNIRIGVVLSPQGGALRTMLPAFRFGLGGPLGSGQQYMSWIALDDLIYAIHRVIVDDQITGPVNATAPNPVTNREFTRTLARVLHRCVGPSAPSSVLRGLGGEMASEMLLASQRILPKRLVDGQFWFQFPDLESALRHLMGRQSPTA